MCVIWLQGYLHLLDLAYSLSSLVRSSCSYLSPQTHSVGAVCVALVRVHDCPEVTVLDVVGLSWFTSICNITSGKVLLDWQPRVLNPLLKISDFRGIPVLRLRVTTVFTLAEEYSLPLLGHL